MGPAVAMAARKSVVVPLRAAHPVSGRRAFETLRLHGLVHLVAQRDWHSAGTGVMVAGEITTACGERYEQSTAGVPESHATCLWCAAERTRWTRRGS